MFLYFSDDFGLDLPIVCSYDLDFGLDISYFGLDFLTNGNIFLTVSLDFVDVGLSFAADGAVFRIFGDSVGVGNDVYWAVDGLVFHVDFTFDVLDVIVFFGDYFGYFHGHFLVFGDFVVDLRVVADRYYSRYNRLFGVVFDVFWIRFDYFGVDFVLVGFSLPVVCVVLVCQVDLFNVLWVDFHDDWVYVRSYYDDFPYLEDSRVVLLVFDNVVRLLLLAFCVEYCRYVVGGMSVD